MTAIKNVNGNYTINVGNPPTAGNGTLTVNANLVVLGSTTNTQPSVSTTPFITVAANNTGTITDMGLLGQTSLTTFAGLRYDSIANSWQVSSDVNSVGAPVSVPYANIAIVGGTDTQLQYNNNGQLAGNPNLTFNQTSNLLSVTGNASITGTVTAGNFVGNVSINSSSEILYVAMNGNDSNNGSFTTPFATIEAAMNVATGMGGNVSVHVAPGIYIENMPITIPPNTALMGDNLRNVTVIPQGQTGDMFYMSSGCYVWGITVKNYTGNAFSYNPNIITTAYVSPYIQNLTSSAPGGTAVYIDGSRCNGTKAMIVGFFTIINSNGIGVHILNSGYSQLVNIYTIACDIGIKVESGGFCTLNGSDCSIGNYGLVATGTGPLQTSGTTVGYSTNGLFVLENLSNGQPHVNTVLQVDGDLEYYTIDTILPDTPALGQSTVLIQQTYTSNTAPGTNVQFFTRSSIIASAHTFEYVGAGTNPATALPQYGGIPIEANEVVMSGGGVVTFTSTDQKGNFKVGQGFTINQATGTITGNDFYKSLFAEMTPYILAISGD